MDNSVYIVPTLMVSFSDAAESQFSEKIQGLFESLGRLIFYTERIEQIPIGISPVLNSRVVFSHDRTYLFRG